MPFSNHDAGNLSEEWRGKGGNKKLSIHKDFLT